MRKVFLILGMILAIALVSAAVYPEAWTSFTDAGGNDLKNVGTLTADVIETGDIYVDNIYGANSSCYQETANVSTSCGGLAGGNYTNSSDWLDVSNFYDGNWSSAATYNGTNGTTGYLYINYSKPSTAISASKIQIKRETAVNNYSIDSNCFSQSALGFRGVAVNSSIGLGSNYWQCYNGSSYVNTTASQAGLKLYEEAMSWKLSTNPFINATIDWTNLKNYPTACPGSSAITGLNDSVTCSDLWVDEAGDTMTGDLIIDGTAMLQLQSNSTTAVCNSTNVGYIYYNGDLNKHYGCNSTGWNGMY